MNKGLHSTQSDQNLQDMLRVCKSIEQAIQLKENELSLTRPISGSQINSNTDTFV